MRVNTPNVVHETIDGEAILLNLKTGNYYSFEGLGAFIWNFIDQKAAWSPLPNLIVEAFQIERLDALSDIELFVQKLVDEELVVEEPLIIDISESESESLKGGLLKSVSSYSSPLVNKYSDMQDLLLLDPIHDVNEKGWPQKKDSK